MRFSHKLFSHIETSEMVNHGAKNAKGNAVSAFVMKLDQVVNDPATDDVITWKKSPDGKLVEPHCVVVLDKERFSEEVMPQYFRGSKYCSFIRQLNAYDFSHVGVVNSSDPPAFTHPYFRKDDRSLLSKIEQDKRSRSTQPEDIKTVKKVEDKIVESYGPTSRLDDKDVTKYVEALQAIRDMLASAQMFGMTHLFMERVKEFLRIERKDFTDIQDENVLEILDNLIRTHSGEPSPAPSTASTASTSSLSEDDEKTSPVTVKTADPLNFEQSLHHTYVPHPLPTEDDFIGFDVDELQELLAEHIL
ncbi:hypothetical protein Ae201684P_005076 [Aphanomyces euteiches]|nr:hypothetical protein Ae201684P_005076 [Aphanomyces euteiches]